jgi:O-antigen/teichoic acid export membrane protein
MAGIRTLPALLRGGSGFAAIVQTGLATVMVLAINVVTGIVSARMLGAQGRGELSALLLCPQFLSFLFTLGLPSSTIVRIKSSPQDAPGLIGTALLLSMLMGVLAAASGVAIAPWLMRQYDAHLISVARLLMVFVMLGVPSTVLIAALQLRERFTAYNRIRFWQSLLILLSLIGLSVVHVFAPVSGAVAYLLPTLPFFVWNAWWVLREFKPTLAGFKAHRGKLLSYGLRVHVMDVGNALFGQLDKIILVAVLAPSMFGIYVVVFNLSRLVTTFANSVIPVLLPRTAGKAVTDVLALTSRALTATTILSVGAVAAFIVFGGLGLRLLYGEQFAAGYSILIILSVEAALAGSAVVLQQPYMVLDRPGTVAVFHTVSLSFAGILIYLGAVRFGAVGAAGGLLTATTVRFTLTYSGFRWLLGLRAPRLLPTRADWASLLGQARGSLA